MLWSAGFTGWDAAKRGQIEAVSERVNDMAVSLPYMLLIQTGGPIMAKRAFRSILFLAALALPSTAGHTQESDAKAIVQPTFDQHFSAYAELPPAPEPGPKEIDLDTFEPPVEVEPASTSLGSGVASYYGRRFHGRRTANGERFDMHAYTAAHKTLPFGSMVEVTNPRTGKSVVVRINDRGPFTPGRTIDLSRAAAEEIGIVRRGHGTVDLALLD